jgi:hypothetical protein
MGLFEHTEWCYYIAWENTCRIYFLKLWQSFSLHNLIFYITLTHSTLIVGLQIMNSNENGWDVENQFALLINSILKTMKCDYKNILIDQILW